MRSLDDIWRSCRVRKGDRVYHTLYEEVIGPRRLEPLELFEVGIFRGSSLEAWTRWLPNATITGMDTFERVPPEDVPILGHERIKWIRGSSAGKLPPELHGKENLFDFIVDDGCHWHCAQRMTFYRCWPLLKPGGVYFIEDVWPFDEMTDEGKRHSWIRSHPGAWTDDAFAGLLKEVSVGDVRRHDFRDGDEKLRPDRYIIEIRK